MGLATRQYLLWQNVPRKKLPQDRPFHLDSLANYLPSPEKHSCIIGIARLCF
jgi:hypothetical protein